MLTIEKSSESIPFTALISLKKMNNIFEVTWCEKSNHLQTIKKLDKDHYMILSTGEIIESNHIENRSQGKAKVSQSLKCLRDYINTNVEEPQNCKWVTLTYAENMRDSKIVYRDLKIFTKSLRRFFGHFEYIYALEPQSRGAWHVHAIMIWNKKAPYIANKKMQEIWGHGFTKTQKLVNIDNIGAYLSAYLGDMTLEEYRSSDIPLPPLKTSQIVFKTLNEGMKEPKAFIKGGRLHFYPPNFNLYRCSRGIKKPIIEYMQYSVAKEKIGLNKPTFSKTLFVSSDSFKTLIGYEQYNTKRK